MRCTLQRDIDGRGKSMSESESKTDDWTFVAFWAFLLGVLVLVCVSQYMGKEQKHKHELEIKQLDQEAGR